MTPDKIELLNRTHVITDEIYGEKYVYRISYSVDESFKEAKSHAAEVELLCTYAPFEEYGHEGQTPCIAVIHEDFIYYAAESFKKTGTVPDAITVTPLSGKFLFKATMEYYGDIIYFYGYDSCDGFWENTGFALVYPKEYAGTENEKRLIQIFDAAAQSYKEEKTEKISDDSRDNSYTAEPADSSSKTSYSSPDITEKATAGDVVKTVAASAVKIRLIARLAILAGIIISIIGGKIISNFKTHHLVQFNGTEEIISEFTADEEENILKAFDVIIPENEGKAHLLSFMRKSMNDKAASYVIEIDGVKDYDAFYSANSERDLGKSVNETDNLKRKAKYKYYITYNELITSKNNKKSENYDQIVELFNSLEKQ